MCIRDRDWSGYLNFFHSWITSNVMQAFLNKKLTAPHMIYGADVMFMCANLAVAAYTIYIAVDRTNLWILGASGIDSGWYYLFGA